MGDRSETLTPDAETGNGRATKLAAAGGIAGAVAASSCCVLPLALFGLGVSGTWIGRLTAMSPYQPIFIGTSILFLGIGHWQVYRTAKTACADGSACARPLPGSIVKSTLWIATGLVGLNVAWPHLVPLILG